MSNQSIITRAEIAELLEISLCKLINIIKHSNVVVPEPLRREGPRLVYDREILLPWIASKPLENLIWTPRTKKTSTAEPIAPLNVAFLSGDIGSSKRECKRKAFRLLAAKHAPRPTQRVEIRGGAYDGFGERRGPKPKQQAAQ